MTPLALSSLSPLPLPSPLSPSFPPVAAAALDVAGAIFEVSGGFFGVGEVYITASGARARVGVGSRDRRARVGVGASEGKCVGERRGEAAGEVRVCDPAMW